MRKTTKIFGIILIILTLLVGMSTISSATYDASSIADDITPQMIDGDGQTQVTTLASQIIGIITTVGIAIAVVIIAILGIKYMVGSASEKAEYKKTMVPYLVGAVLLFGASAIGKMLVGMISGLTGASSTGNQ